ncbi:uncharacterized protein [Littorina saxatilis]|uniref:ZP domain-containing protein n=1 Tax=Littorina saxatilis TaxID=31220 RepID=A0AAN9B8F6_9CAEN
MARTFCVVLVTMTLLLSSTMAEALGTRIRKSSIPGAVLRGVTLNDYFLPSGLQGNSDPECAPSDPSYDCPEGWTGFVDDQGPVCLLVVEEPLSHTNANRSCQRKGGKMVSILTEKRQRSVESVLEGVTESVWTGLYREDNSRRYLWPNNVQMEYRNSDLSTDLSSYVLYNRRRECVYMQSPNRDWKRTRQCDTVLLSFVCDLVPDCNPGRFGKFCDKECHCHGKSCQGEQPCQYGCQVGWMGPHCCAKKEPAEVAHYCINTAEEGRHMLLRVDPKGVTYDLLTPIDVSGQRLSWCRDVTMSRELDGRYTVKVPIIDEANGTGNDNGSTSTNNDCGEEKIGENVFRWRVLLQEKKGLLLPMDRTLVFTCDFNKAETLVRGLQYSIKSDLESLSEDLLPLEEKPEEVQEDVVLQAIDPYSGDVIQQAALGSSVALRIRLNVAQEVTAQAVSPFNCRAASPDGTITGTLPDFSWCPLNSTAASALSDSNGTVVSKPFQLFTFQGYRDVVISCNFRLCFGSLPCKGHCGDHGERKKRSANGNTKRVTARIHVLPEAHADTMDAISAARNNQSMAAKMMTPVTWFLVAVSMLISGLLVYILFRRSRRQPVRQIR